MISSSPSRFQQSLQDNSAFTLTFELVPSRGGWTKEHTRILCLARGIARDGRIQAVSITENAGGHPALSPEVLGREIMEMGLDVISHFSCKDKNRNQMESLLFSWDRQGLRNLLVITGDYPKKGYYGCPKPVFDLDSVQLLDLIARMNRGRIGIKRAGEKSSPIGSTSFFCGVAVSPFKTREGELIMQYLKLQRKIARGAQFAITQVGYDPRKFHELFLYLHEHNINLPLLGNVFIPSRRVIELMHDGDIPGCIVPDRLYSQFQGEFRNADEGKQARLERGAKLLAVLKGIGFAGAHIGGPGLSIKDIEYLLDQAEKHGPNWPEFVEELSCWPHKAFHYFQRDDASGLNNTVRTTVAKKNNPNIPHTLSKTAHDIAFTEGKPLYRFMKSICLAAADTPFEGLLNHTEYFIKVILFHCRNCGDCTLAELAYLCPQWGCAKYILNGPCGGSSNGWCEVYPGARRCLYVRLYERLSTRNIREQWPCGFIPPRNWALNDTSSWTNYFLGRDHASNYGNPPGE